MYQGVWSGQMGSTSCLLCRHYDLPGLDRPLPGRVDPVSLQHPAVGQEEGARVQVRVRRRGRTQLGRPLPPLKQEETRKFGSEDGKKRCEISPRLFFFFKSEQELRKCSGFARKDSFPRFFLVIKYAKRHVSKSSRVMGQQQQKK